MASIASLFSDVVPQASGYTPDYFQNVQQIYQQILPGQTLDTEALSSWYRGDVNIPFGRTEFAAPISPPLGGPSIPNDGLLTSSDMGGGGFDNQSGVASGRDDVGLASYNNVSPAAIRGMGIALSLMGLPGGLFSTNAVSLANALNSFSYNQAANYNKALLAAQLNLSENDPANAAALASAIDSLSAFNSGTASATAGASGTGGAAASAAAVAAEAAASAGYSDAAIGAASQAAANAVVNGASLSGALAAGEAAAAIAEGNIPSFSDFNSGLLGLSSSEVGQAEQAAVEAALAAEFGDAAIAAADAAAANASAEAYGGTGAASSDVSGGYGGVDSGGYSGDGSGGYY